MARPIDQWVLVTGATDGALGEATVSTFLTRGYNVIATSTDREDFNVTKPTEGTTDGFLVRLGLEPTSTTAVETAVERIADITNGKLNYLINIAGCGYYMPLIDTRIRDARHAYDVNVWGTLSLTQAFFPMLREAKGTVVNHITAAGLSNLNDPFMGVYASSQIALRSMGDTLRVELAPFDVKVITFITKPANAQPARRTTEDLRVGLPKGSPYSYIEDDAVGAMLGRITSESAHDWHAEAERMLAELMKTPTPKYIVNGYVTLLLWWIGWILPAWLTDWVASQRGELSRLHAPPSVSSEHKKTL